MSMQNMIREMIREIGDDPMRKGLLDTPNRIINSWQELYAGNWAVESDIEKMMTVFTNDCYDEMVLLKDIEFYSTCEHHMLPFFGKCHVAYIPGVHIIGISKLARLVEVYARRLQIQERIGHQITKTIDKYLKPQGSACIIEAQHFCMTSRGVQKQNSIMVTSSLTGVFRKKSEARQELMGLIK